MTENAVGIPGTSDLLRTELQATSAGQVNAEVIVVADATNVNAILKITDADPAPSDFGAVVRDPVMITVAAALAVMDDWDENDRAKVNLIVGQAGVDGGAGATTAATQRVILASDQPAITVSFSPSGTQDENLTQVGGAAITLGQKLMAASIPVVLASDQSVTIVGTEDSNLIKIAGATVQTGHGTAAGTLRVELPTDGTGQVTANQGTSPWAVSGTVTATPSGTQDENLKQVNGVAVNVGTGVAGTGTQRVAVASDSSITANAGTNLNTSALALEAGGNLAAIAGKDFATQATLALIKAKTDNLDVALSTRLKAADTLTAVTTVATITNPVGVKGADGSAIASNANPMPVSDAGGSITVDGTVTANQGTAGASAWPVNDDCTHMECQDTTLGASTDTTITFAQAVRTVRVVNWDASNVVLVKDGAIASNTDATATRVGVAPATNVPNTRTFPYKTTAVHLRSAGASHVSVEGFF